MVTAIVVAVAVGAAVGLFAWALVRASALAQQNLEGPEEHAVSERIEVAR